MSSAEGGLESGHDSDPDWYAKKEKSRDKHKGGWSLISDKMDASNHGNLLVRMISLVRLAPNSLLQVLAFEWRR